MHGLRARAFVILQWLLPQHLLSSFAYRLTRSRRAALKNALIGAFVRHFRPVMHEAAQPDALRYESFNDFFTRALAPAARPIAADTHTLTSPVDGTVSQIGYLRDGRLIQAKGRDYRLEALLGGASTWSQALSGGGYATLYLAPYNYHRIHMPCSGRLKAAWYVPGRLFSVNATTAAGVADLFARNERVILMFERPGPSAADSPALFAMVLVGALFVGSITTRWHGEVTPRRPRRALELAGDATEWLAKGEEMGRFNMGSTVILIHPAHALEWLPTLAPGSTIRVGEPLARLSASS
jgi:phosphatidylserine decarboxylase